MCMGVATQFEPSFPLVDNLVDNVHSSFHSQGSVGQGHGSNRALVLYNSVLSVRRGSLDPLGEFGLGVFPPGALLCTPL